MKKLVFIILLTVIGYITYAQKDTTTITGTNTEKLIDKYSTKIEASIISLAQTLKQPAEHVYKVLVKQQIVYGISSLLGLLLTSFFLYLGIRLGTKHEWEEPEEFFLTGFSIIGLLITMIMFFNGGIGGLINPEYGALKDIIDMIK